MYYFIKNKNNENKQKHVKKIYDITKLQINIIFTCACSFMLFIYYKLLIEFIYDVYSD